MFQLTDTEARLEWTESTGLTGGIAAVVRVHRFADSHGVSVTRMREPERLRPERAQRASDYLARQAQRAGRHPARPEHRGAHRRDHRVTSSGLCGSDLHLYEVLVPCMEAGDILGHEPMGVVEEVGAEVTQIVPGDRVVVPFNIACGRCYMCDRELYSQCETTQVHEHDKGAALFGYSKLYGQVPSAQAGYLRVPQAQFYRSRCQTVDRFLFPSDVLPTAWRAVEYAAVPRTWEPARDRARAYRRHVRSHCPRAWLREGDRARPRARATRPGLGQGRLGDRRRRGGGDTLGEIGARTSGRGADSVIDAVGLEAHGDTSRRPRAARRAVASPIPLEAPVITTAARRAAEASPSCRPRPPWGVNTILTAPSAFSWKVL